MSEHENNKMEAWLKAYRQQRLDQWNEAPVELDEPTRAMLMAEVRRQNPATHAIIAETTPRQRTYIRLAALGPRRHDRRHRGAGHFVPFAISIRVGFNGSGQPRVTRIQFSNQSGHRRCLARCREPR